MTNTIALTDSSNMNFGNQVQVFITRYYLHVQKSASSILELANIVFTAKNELSKKEFLEFRLEIGADYTKNSYIKKLCVIADNQSRFDEIRNILPSSYTTIYELAKIDSKLFKQILETGIISPQMTAKTLNKFLKKSKISAKSVIKSSKEKQCIRYNLELDNIEDDTAHEIIKEINTICNKYYIYFECEIIPMNSVSDGNTQDDIYDHKLAA